MVSPEGQRQLCLIGQDALLVALSTAAVHFFCTRPGTKDRITLTHTLWWYPFVVYLCYVGFTATWELLRAPDHRLVAHTEQSELFMRLYVAVQVVSVFVEGAQDQPLSKKLMTLAHHVVSTVAYLSGLLDTRCHFYATAGGLSETSTIFLEGLLLSRHPVWAPWFTKNAPWFGPLNGCLLWLSFIIFRLVLFPVLVATFFYDRWTAPVEISEGMGAAFYAYPAVLAFLFFLSAAWFQKIHKGFVEKVLGKAKAGKAPGKAPDGVKASNGKSNGTPTKNGAPTKKKA